MPRNRTIKVLGLTGGIGSGKSVIGLIFSDLGYPVFDSDQSGRELLTKNNDIVKKITTRFGSEFLNQLGQLDRKKLSALVFENPDALEKLNQIIHPAVHTHFISWLNNQTSEFAIRESALLFETGFYKDSFRNILIVAPEELRIQRVMKRNSLLREDVLARMKNQWSDEQKSALADFIIVNDDKEPVLPQVWKIIDSLKKVHETA